MDIDETKKRKISEEPEKPETIDLESVLKAYIENANNLAKLLAIVTQKVVAMENMFNKDLLMKD